MAAQAAPRRQRLVIGLVLGLVIIGLLVVALDWREVRRILSATDWRLVPVALFFTAISYTCLSFSFVTAGRIFGIRIDWRDLSAIGFVTVSLNYLLSSMGVAGYSVRFLLMREEGVAPRDTVAASLFGDYLDSLGLLALLPIGLGYLFVKHPLSPGATIAVGVAALLLVALFFVAAAVLFVRSLRAGVLRGLGRVVRLVTRRDLTAALDDFDATMSRGVSAAQTRPQLLALMLALAVIDWTATVAALSFCFDALGDPISLGVLLTGFALGVAAGIVSMVPGGLGIQEGSMAGLYALLGVPLQKAILASILFRLVYYLVPFVVSLPFQWRLLRRAARYETKEEATEER